MPSNARSFGFSKWAVAAALAAAVALVAVLGMQRRAQDERYAALLRDTSLPRGRMYVPTFTAPTVDGSSVTVGERRDGGKQVLFLFTTTCPYCKASLPAVREVALAAAQELAPGATMYGIVLDSLSLAAEYASVNDLRFPIVEFPARKLRVHRAERGRRRAWPWVHSRCGVQHTELPASAAIGIAGPCRAAFLHSRSFRRAWRVISTASSATAVRH